MQYRKTIISSIFIALLAISGIGAAFAQDESADDTPTPFCVPAEGNMQRGERPDPVIGLLGIGVTQDEIDAARDAGTFEELLEQYDDELEAAREANRAEFEAARAEREAAKEAFLLECVTNAEAEGLITAEQAATLTDAIENDTLREVLRASDGEFDGLFPTHEGRGKRGDGRRGRGNNGERPAPPNGAGNGQAPAPQGQGDA